MAHDVFISYSTMDKAIADAICAALEAARVRCWIAPRDIRPGEKWQEAIVQAIGHSRVMVLVFSSHSNVSEDVSKELTLAVRNGCIIVPFRIEAIEPQGVLQYYLADTHWLDAMNPPTEQEIQKLVTTVTLFLKGEIPSTAARGPARSKGLSLGHIIGKAKAKPIYVAVIVVIALLGVALLLSLASLQGSPYAGASFLVIGNVTPPAYNVKQISMYQDKALILTENSLEFLDVNNLSFPVSPLSFTDNETVDMAQGGNRTYVLLRSVDSNLSASADTYRVQAIDPGDPRQQQTIWEKTFASTDTDSTPANIAVDDNVLFMGNWNGFYLVRLGLPAGYVYDFDSVLNHTSFPSEGAIHGNMLFASSFDMGVGLWDIADLKTTTAYQLFNTDGQNPISFIHAINPYPSWVKAHLCVHNDTLFFDANAIYAYDVGNPDQPEKVAEFGVGDNPNTFFSNLKIDGDVLYAAFFRNDHYQRYIEGGVAAFDIRNPALPQLISKYYTASAVNGLSVRDGLVCISTSEPGITLLRLQK